MRVASVLASVVAYTIACNLPTVEATPPGAPSTDGGADASLANDGGTHDAADGAVEACAPGTTRACFSGPPASAGVGSCKGGTQTCLGAGTGYGACVGEVLPKSETCASTRDDDCDGAPAPPCPPPYTIEIQTGANQSKFVAQQLAPISIRVVDTATKQPLPLATVDVVVPPGVGVLTPTITTSSQGVATLLVTNGLQPAAYSVKFSMTGAADLLVPEASTKPAKGTVFTIMNTINSATKPTLPIAATLAGNNRIFGLAAAPDGSIYFSDDGGYIGKISPAGQITRIGRDGFTVNAGDGGPIANADFAFVRAMEFDASANRLLVGSYDRIRTLDFGTGLIDTLAGGGAATGTNILATDAALDDIFISAIGSDHAIYFGTRTGNNTPQAQSVTPAGILKTWLDGSWDGVGTANCAGDPLILAPDYAPPSAADNAGNVYVASRICGTIPAAAGLTPGVVKVTSAGIITHVAGRENGSTEEDVLAATRALGPIVMLAHKPGSQSLYLMDAEPTSDVCRSVRRINLATGKISTVVGNGVHDPGGDFVAGTTTSAKIPCFSGVDLATVLPNGNLVFVEESPGGASSRLRMLWDADP